MKKRRVPERLDMSILEFLEHGDKTAIVLEEQKAGYKTTIVSVSRVCRGLQRNDRILARAFKIAIQRMGKFPKQAIKPLS